MIVKRVKWKLTAELHLPGTSLAHHIRISKYLFKSSNLILAETESEFAARFVVRLNSTPAYDLYYTLWKVQPEIQQLSIHMPDISLVLAERIQDDFIHN